jgi:ketoreductase RED1
MVILSNTINLHVEDHGRGTPTLVFLHYWGGSSRTWRHVVKELAPDFRTVAIDQRGWGQSDKPDTGYALADLADDAQGVIEQLGLDRFILVGHSMGGKVAQLLASRKLPGLMGMVLVAPAPPSAMNLPLEVRQGMVDAYASRESILATVEQVLAGSPLAPSDLDMVVADSLAGAPAARQAWPLAASQEDITQDVARITVPTLVISGEEDRVDPPAVLRQHLLPRIAQARLHVLPGIGHLAPLEALGEIDSLIRGFAASLDVEKQVETVTIVGGGVIGASWAALFLAHGRSVVVSDPAPDIADKVKRVILEALPTLEGLGHSTAGLFGRLTFESDLAKAVVNADLVQENGPEKIAFKRKLWAAIEAAAPEDALLLSSSSSIPASEQNRDMVDPGRLIIGHPFNPPHLMPLVEVVPSAASNPDLVVRAMAFYREVGKVPLELKKEIPGFVANRLQAAIFRECVYLVREGIVSIRDLDAIVTNSLGLRWASDGPFLSFHLGGGAGGMAHFIEHLGKGGMEALWASFGEVSFDEATSNLLIDQTAQFYGATPTADLVAGRDAREVAILNGFKRLPL